MSSACPVLVAEGDVWGEAAWGCLPRHVEVEEQVIDCCYARIAHALATTFISQSRSPVTGVTLGSAGGMLPLVEVKGPRGVELKGKGTVQAYTFAPDPVANAASGYSFAAGRASGGVAVVGNHSGEVADSEAIPLQGGQTWAADAPRALSAFSAWEYMQT